MAGWYQKDILLEMKKSLPGPCEYKPNPDIIKDKTTNIFIGKRYEDN